MSHAAQVALTLFAYIANKNQIACGTNLRMPQRRRNCQQCHHTRAIVAGTRSSQPHLIQLRLDRCIRGKYSVNVRREQYALSATCFATTDADRISDSIQRHILQPEFVELPAEPFCASSFTKWRSSYRNQFLLPAHNLLLMQMQPAERFMHAPLRGKLADARKRRSWNCGRHEFSVAFRNKC